ncbi:MAG: DHHA1 domain-containing protein, partial [Planctomycetota bacterium]
VLKVIATKKDGALLVHPGPLARGTWAVGAGVTATVATGPRDAIRRAHSATHLLHNALHKTLGEHAQQQGSKVDADWLRFDFSNLSPVGDDALATISADVKAHVAASAEVKWETLPLAEARGQGAMMLFGEKYPDPVRMVSMGPMAGGAMSRELCGGTHLTNTSQVDAFEILHEEGVSAGTRRITALTGEKARRHAEEIEAAIDRCAQLLGTASVATPAAVTDLLEQQRGLKKQLAGGEPHRPGAATLPLVGGRVTYKQKKAALIEAARMLSVAPLDTPARVEAILADIKSLREQLAQREAAGPLDADTLLAGASDVAGVRVVVAEAPGAAPNLMRQLIDAVRQKTQPAAVLLAARQGDDKVTIVAGVTKDLQERGVAAGKWIGPVAKAVGGGGGGRPDMAQAGGKQPERLPQAFEVARETLAGMLES